MTISVGNAYSGNTFEEQSFDAIDMWQCVTACRNARLTLRDVNMYSAARPNVCGSHADTVTHRDGCRDTVSTGICWKLIDNFISRR